MNKSTFFTGQPIFTQLVSLIPKHVIKSAIREFSNDRYCKKFDTYHHLLTMLYCCYQNCTSLREVATGMRVCEGRLQSVGMEHLPARSTISDANRYRSYEVFQSIFYRLYEMYRPFLSDSKNDELSKKLIIIDSTTISLFKEIMENAGRRAINGKKKGGIKVHIAMKASENVPYLIDLTKGSKSDMPFLNKVIPPADSVIVMDKGYHVFSKYNEWTKNKVNWVTRSRTNSVIEHIRTKHVSKKDSEQGIVSDEIVMMGYVKNKKERVKCCLVRYYDSELDYTFEFITNNFRWSPIKIADIYKRRWQIELLFKRLKQNLPLEYFLGDNENAIKIQIFCTLIADLVVKVALLKVKRKWAHSNVMSFIRLHLMNYTKLREFLDNPEKCKISNPIPITSPQLKLEFG